MPTFQGLLRETEIQGLMAFIKSLGSDPNGGPPAPTVLALPPPPAKPGTAAAPGQTAPAATQAAPVKQAPK